MEKKNGMLTWVFVLCEEDYVLKLRRTQIEAASMKNGALSLSLSHTKKHNGTRWWRKNRNIYIYYDIYYIYVKKKLEP